MRLTMPKERTTLMLAAMILFAVLSMTGSISAQSVDNILAVLIGYVVREGMYRTKDVNDLLDIGARKEGS